MTIVEWIKAGWNNYTKRWKTYDGLVLLTVVVLALLFVGTTTSLVGLAKTKELEVFLMGLLVAAPAIIIAGSLIVVYFMGALYLTAAEGGGIKSVLKRAAERYLSFLGASILTNIVVIAPPLVGMALDSALRTHGVFTVLGYLAMIYVVIKLVTAIPRVALGDSAVDAVRKAWETPFTESLKIVVALILVELVLVVLAFVPALAVLIGLFVVGPWATATAVEATRALS